MGGSDHPARPPALPPAHLQNPYVDPPLLLALPLPLPPKAPLPCLLDRHPPGFVVNAAAPARDDAAYPLALVSEGKPREGDGAFSGSRREDEASVRSLGEASEGDALQSYRGGGTKPAREGTGRLGGDVDGDVGWLFGLEAGEDDSTTPGTPRRGGGWGEGGGSRVGACQERTEKRAQATVEYITIVPVPPCCSPKPFPPPPALHQLLKAKAARALGPPLPSLDSVESSYERDVGGEEGIGEDDDAGPGRFGALEV